MFRILDSRMVMKMMMTMITKMNILIAVGHLMNPS
uniref:Uncharacterized protein n=1 Tax=Schistosoma japonicum TaxID=6182 RepID=Q5C7S4_SCHJA|nr:unknown [Schistosoma japonicum]